MEIFSDIKEVANKVEQLLNSVLMVVVDVLEFKGEQAIKLEYKVWYFELNKLYIILYIYLNLGFVDVNLM